MRPYTRTIANNAETRIAARGRVLFVDDSTAGVLISLRKDETGRGDGLQIGPITMRSRQKISTVQVFDDVTIRNESGASVTITVLIGDSDFDAPLSEVALEPATTNTGVADVVVGVGETAVLAADPSRKRAHIKSIATSAAACRIGGTGSVGAAQGAQLNPGEGLTIEGTGAITAIQDGGACTLSVTIEDRP